MSRKLNKTEIIHFGKGLRELCRGLSKSGKESFTSDICISDRGKRYKVSITTVEEN